ncbi:hypothetical protein CALCODRAFT_479467 [Calocera cornea HHB12733]|uniref:histidine kinase n=1 Tax=Calocera cornea HHB12733 TaxID=1353952 RepID=A0A165JL30_9BASI|nr:hypothetical protein CALCODRAFT_479467 [Calocera cornea HHB12733]
MQSGDDTSGDAPEGLPPPATARSAKGSKKSKSSKTGKASTTLRQSLFSTHVDSGGEKVQGGGGILGGTPAGGANKKVTTFEPGLGPQKPLKVRFQEFLKVISTAVSLSDSPIEPTIESTEASSYRANIQRRESDWGIEEDPSAPPPEVNEVVVDAEWDMDKWAELSMMDRSDSAGAGAAIRVIPLMETSHASRALGSQPDGRSQEGFTAGANSSGIRELWGLTSTLRWRLYPRIVRFFDLSFYSEYSEDKYRKDVWFTQKKLAALSAAFYLLITIFNCTLVAKPFSKFNKITNIGGGIVFSLPVIILVLLNFPRMKIKYQWPYQIILMVATWQWAWYNVFDQWQCGFFISRAVNTCGAKDFQLTPFYSAAMPFLALFALNQNRFFATIGFVSFQIMSGILIIPRYTTWSRYTVNSTIWHILLLYVHFTLETAERRSYTLREQLKDQCKATQKAQVNERKESDSKKRFVSYIFHEVRVPLNTALLAAQNLIGSGGIKREDDVEFQALEGSLKMMSKVLNDVLDFNRMDSGRFVTVSKPYCFHTAIRSMLLPLELSARSRGLALTMRLDPKIDEIANRAAYGNGDELDSHVGKEGWVLGDEMRLRQLITNLTSNACKFTSEGGRVHVETRLILPQLSEQPAPLPVLLEVDPESSDQEAIPPSTPVAEDPHPPLQLMNTIEDAQRRVGTTGVHRPIPMHVGFETGAPIYTPATGRSLSVKSGTVQPHKAGIVVRIEVRDTGVGIKPRDLIDNRLFSPYVQTEIGRFQGGKGTGLGLALVRNIVKLSGGRLGVKSRVGVGSTFWVELSLGVGPNAINGRDGFSRSRPPHMSKSITSHDYASPPIARPDTPLMSPLTAPLQYTPGPNENVSSEYRTTVDPLSGHIILPPPRLPQTPQPLAYRPELPACPQSPRSPPVTEESDADTPTAPQTQNPTAVEVQPLMTQKGDPPALVTGSVPVDLNKIVTEEPKEEPLPILVVDDDMLTRRLMSRMLTRIGCSVEIAENGQVALDCLIGPGAHSQAVSGRKLPSSTSTLLTPGSEHSTEPVLVSDNKYAVVFLDNQMPFYSGVQVVDYLRALGRTTFVVGVTGNALKEDQLEYLEAGVDKILTKPVLEKDLRNVVAIARERYKQLQAGAEPTRYDRASYFSS